MRLDSLGYRLLWNFKRLLRFTDWGPAPIILGNNNKEFRPPPNLRCLLDLERSKNLDLLINELQVLVRVTRRLPENLSENDWIRLIHLPNAKERFEHLNFLYLRQKLKAKDEINRQKRVEARNHRKEKQGTSHIFVADQPRLITLRESHIDRLERRLASLRCVKAFQNDQFPRIALDCRWLHLHSDRAMSLAVKQIGMLIKQNAERESPWPIWLTNFASEDLKLKELRGRKLGILDGLNNFTAHVTNASYLEIFAEQKKQEKIVYLSPHSKERLQSVNADTCYVIGAIVDRCHEPNIPSRASLATAELEELQCRRLPLDYLILKGGNPLFTLDQVLRIIQDAFDLNDWQKALNSHIPMRKLKSPVEKNQSARLIHKNLALRNQAILQILKEQNVGNG